MDVRTNIEKRLPSRHLTAGPECAPRGSHRSADAALHRPAIVGECGIKFDLMGETEIFKKTPCVADSKPGSRDVAKDEFEIGALPLLAIVGTVNVKLTDAETVERKTKWKVRETNHRSGALWKYAQQIGPVVDGTVTRPGGAHEKQCYADI
jgi:dihydroxyacid dehydratase/phosphogluconate dehydratase